VAVIGAVAGDDLFDEALQGFGVGFFMGNEQGLPLLPHLNQAHNPED
jgi:hypothetical protein